MWFGDKRSQPLKLSACNIIHQSSAPSMASDSVREGNDRYEKQALRGSKRETNKATPN